MATKKKVIWITASGVSILGVLTILLMLPSVKVQHSGDIRCSDVCESFFNITPTYKTCFNITNLIQTDADGVKVELYWKYYGRWKKFDLAKDCITARTKKEFKVVGYKKPEQTVKWGVQMFGIDPLWMSTVDGNLSYELNHNLNQTRSISQQFQPNWTNAYVNWSNNISLAGNFSWNFTEGNISTYPVVDFTYNFTNNGTTNITVRMKLNQSCVRCQLWCWNTTNNASYRLWNITPVWSSLFNLTTNTTKKVNCTLDLLNISQAYINWTLNSTTAVWDFNVSVNITTY